MLGWIICGVVLLQLEGQTFLESCHNVADSLLAQTGPAGTVEIPDLLRRVRADADPGDGPDDGSLLRSVGRTASPAS